MERIRQWIGPLLLLTLLLVVSTGPAEAQPTVSVQLEPAGGSDVRGTAVLTAEGDGTRVNLEIAGLAPGSPATATMQAGTCATPGASAAALPALTADANGKATASGMILFRGTENVALTAIADDAHTIVVAGPSGMVACGQIPALGGDSLPATGASTSWLLTVLLLAAGLVTISCGLWVRMRLVAARGHQ